jgi:hypothetical protein
LMPRPGAPSTERRRADWNPRDSLSEGSAGGRIDSRVLARLLSPLHRCGRQLLVRCPQMALARLLCPRVPTPWSWTTCRRRWWP